MTIPVAWLQRAAWVLLVAWCVWLAGLWQPARQVELHTGNLLRRASARDWPAVEAMMAAGYRDAWGHDRATSIDEARTLLSHFFALQIAPTGPWRCAGEDGERLVSVELGVFGSGTALAHAVMDAVREAEGPFFFRWRRAGAWPWQWELVEAGHEGLAAKYRR